MYKKLKATSGSSLQLGPVLVQPPYVAFCSPDQRQLVAGIAAPEVCEGGSFFIPRMTARVVVKRKPPIPVKVSS